MMITIFSKIILLVLRCSSFCSWFVLHFLTVLTGFFIAILSWSHLFLRSRQLGLPCLLSCLSYLLLLANIGIITNFCERFLRIRYLPCAYLKLMCNGLFTSARDTRVNAVWSACPFCRSEWNDCVQHVSDCEVVERFWKVQNMKAISLYIHTCIRVYMCIDICICIVWCREDLDLFEAMLRIVEGCLKES